MNNSYTNPENGRTGPEPGPDSGPAILNIKVSHGLNQHDVAVPSNSTFGDLKSVIVQKIGVKPETHKLLFRGKEKEDDEFLQTAGVKDNCKVLLMEDTTCRQKSPEEVKETSVISRGGAAVAAVREEVDKLADQVAALQAVVDGGTQIDNKDIIYLTEMLMRQLLKLDGIEAEGEGKVQRKMEVRRVQSLVETMDIVKSRNSNLFSNVNNTAVTSQWETFETGSGVTSTMSAAPSPAPAPAPTPQPAPAPAPTPVPSSMRSATPVPSCTPIPTPLPSSTPTPSPMSSSTPTTTPIQSSTPTPVPSSTPTVVPFSVPVSISSPSSSPSPLPSSTKVTEEWERFD